jgi:hypothetical protein
MLGLKADVSNSGPIAEDHHLKGSIEFDLGQDLDSHLGDYNCEWSKTMKRT